MESKYYNNAKKIIDSTKFYDGIGNVFPNEAVIISIMCQLAEEVENEQFHIAYRKILTENAMPSQEFKYSKPQVEELLQKQRELSAESADVEVIDHEEWEAKNLPPKDGTYVILPIYGVDEDSILDAKLKFD